MRLFIFLYILSALFCTGKVLSAQSYFSKNYNLANDSSVNFGICIQPFQGDYMILVGRNKMGNDHAGLVRINEWADTQKVKIYYLENQATPPDPGLSMVVNNDKVFFGSSFKNGDVGRDIQLVCISATTMDTLWVKSYPSPLDDEAVHILETPDDALIIISVSKKPTVGNKLRLTKTDKSGNVLWDNFYDEFIRYLVGTTCITQDGQVLISANCVAPNTPSEISVLTKVNLSGNKLWTKTYNISDNFGSPISVTSLHNGGIALGWVRDTFPPGATLYAFPPTLYILDSLGNIEAEHTFFDRWRRDLIRLHTLPDGDILGIGMASGHPDTLNDGGWLFRISPTGVLRWQRAIRDTRYYFGLFFDAVPTSDGGILACGYNAELPFGSPLWLFKIGGNGCYESDCGELELFVSPTQEIPLTDKTKYRLWPNPARSTVHLTGLSGEEVRMDIFDISGRLILRTDLPVFSGISVHHLLPGHYIVKILLNDNRFTTLKLIKP